MKALVIHNPFSGSKRQTQRTLKSFLEYLQGRQVQYSVTTTEGNIDNPYLDDKVDKKTTHVIVVGGDGTLNEVVNTLTKDIPISIIKGGTGNDFIKTLELGKGKKQFETALTGDVKTIDLGSCNGRKFINGVGIGFDGQIVEDMARKKVPFLSGHAKYYFHVLQILSTYSAKPFQARTDENNINNNFILMTIGNGTTFGGGFKLMPNAQIDDGLLEICTVGNISPIGRFLNISKLSNGSHGKLKEVNFYKTSNIKIDSTATLFAHMDGERIGSPPFDIKVLPRSLKVRVANI